MIKKDLLKLVPKSKIAIVSSTLLKIINLILNIKIVFYLVDSLLAREIYWMLIVFIIIKAFVVYLDIQMTQHISSLVKVSLREHLLNVLLSSGYRKSKSMSSSTMSQVSTEGIEHLDSYFSLYLPQFVYSMVAPLILFSVIRVYSLKIAIVLLLGVPLIPLSIIAIQKIAKRILNKYWDSYTQLGDSFLENVKGLTDLKIYGVDGLKSMEMEQESESFRQATMRVLLMQLNSIAMMDLVAYGGAMIAVLMSYRQYSDGLITVYGVLIIILLSADFFLPMRRLGSYFHVAMNGIAAHERLEAILNMECYERKNHQYVQVEDILSLNNVSFKYPDFGLEAIDIVLKTGMFQAIVGVSGSGKSTVAKLIMNDLVPNSGEICLFQEPLDKKNLYDEIVYLGSDAFIIKGTLAENLRIKEDYDKQMCRVVLDKLKLDHLSLDLDIDERGANLSGGEKQRIAFARAVLLNPSVFILDEFTSSLDMESEKIVLDFVDALLLKGKAVLMISHQLKNVEKADEIMVLDKGRLVESGTHDELLSNRSCYFNLYKQQETYLSFMGKEVTYE
ncbi:ABC transporter ATP-binding protein/permease [Erysipelothrix urinaevulpis]|uniref:ABC transporter ATP-binding protein/permease n=1 Tax=Erysipelothrix urinaevulpis TaxID=2683717 RepID=UPI001F15AADF|nr:ATP-binding cassette domain-containing protein [Erysipelothrix urinaevulpis]